MVTLQKSAVVLSVLSAAIGSVQGKTWRDNDPVPFSVKALSPGGNSYDGKLYLHPVSYYDPVLDNPKPVLQNGSYDSEIFHFDDFFGNHYFNAPFNSTFNNNSAKCELLADRNYKEVNVTKINDLIKKNYKLNFFVDDIPVGRELYDSQTSSFYIDNGVPLGYIDINKVPHLFNHFQFVINYVSNGLEYEILYATVSTQSLTRVPQVPLACHLSPPMVLRYSDYAYNGNRISYQVLWKDIQLTRPVSSWDLYKNDVVRPVVSNTIFLMFTVLTLIIGVYTYYTINSAFNLEKLSVIYKNRSSGTKVTTDDESKKDTITPSPSSGFDDDADSFDTALELSWPSLVNDVFRKPDLPSLLYYLVSQGFHFTIASALVIAQLGLGFIKLHGHGNSLSEGVFTVFLVTSPLPSFINSYLFKSFVLNGKEASSTPEYYKKLAISLAVNSLTLPLIVYWFIGGINKAHRSVDSPIQIPTHQYDKLSYSYIFITFISYLISLKFFWKPTPYHSSEIAKKISTPPFTFRSIPNMIISGLFPFGVVLIPLSTIYLTLWYNHFFVTGSLVYAYILLVLLLTAISVLNIYYSLSIGNWKWQWYSFLSGVSIGFYSFGYSFYLTKFKFGDYASFMIFLYQNLIISLILGLVGGFITFSSSFIFVRKLYSDL